VRLIFRLAWEGDGTSRPMGVKSITNHLNASGIRTRDGGRWGIEAVHKVLTRTTYIGRHRFNTKFWKTRERKLETEVVEIAVPPIIDAAESEAVQALLKARSPAWTAPRIVSGPTLLTGICFCAACGIPNRPVYPFPGHVEVQLSTAAKNDADRTLVQLSHETVHTLWPIGVNETHVIEEGAATYFSMQVQGCVDQTYPRRFTEGLTGAYSAYLVAERDVRALLSTNPAAIREARRGRSFCEITAKDLTDAGCEADAARRLVTKFRL
jgi:hypothetical protein